MVPSALSRFILSFAYFGLMIGSGLQATVAQNRERPIPWYTKSVVGMEVGPTGAQFGNSDPTDRRYCENWNGGQIVQRCVEANAEYLVLWLRDGDYAYYDSRLLPKAPGLGQRDPLQEALAEADKHDLPIISYCVVQQGGLCLEAHPEWRMRDVNGNPINRFCFNSGYQELLQKILEEQLAYGIDGFHIDMLDQGFGEPYGCWCEQCQALFKQRYQKPMPTEIRWDADWKDLLEFRYWTSQHLENELTEHIKSMDPEATVDFNYHGSPPFSFEVGQRPVQHAGNGDFVTGETGVWGFSALGVGLNAEFYKAATPGVPVQVAIQRGVRMYHDQTTRPINDMRWETLTLLAHGAFVTMIDKTAFDGTLDPVAYERMGEVLTEARTKRAHFGQRPVREVGIYFSSKSRDWVGRQNPGEYFRNFQGLHQVCAMEHLQFGVILDENADLETLAAYPVVCLPNVGILSEAEVQLLEAYVRQGGNLILTGQPGQFDPVGNPLEQPILEKLIGAKVVERLESKDNWLKLEEASAGEALPGWTIGVPVDWPFLNEGPATIYRPISATGIGQLQKPDRTKRQLQGKMGTDWPMSPGQAVGPALLIHRIGNGAVITCAGSPDFATASEHALVENRKLLANLIRWLIPNRRVTIDGPANVEAVVTDDPEQRVLRIHLLGYNPTPRTTPATNRPYVLPGLIEDNPIFRVQISAAGVTSVESVAEATEIKKRNDGWVVTVEDVHDVILMHY